MEKRKREIRSNKDIEITIYYSDKVDREFPEFFC